MDLRSCRPARISARTRPPCLLGPSRPARESRRERGSLARPSSGIVDAGQPGSRIVDTDVDGCGAATRNRRLHARSAPLNGEVAGWSNLAQGRRETGRDFVLRTGSRRRTPGRRHCARTSIRVEPPSGTGRARRTTCRRPHRSRNGGRGSRAARLGAELRGALTAGFRRPPSGPARTTDARSSPYTSPEFRSHLIRSRCVP
jgi:hypothetical protein